jgi:hypothetical protein
LPRALSELTAFLEENNIADVNELVGAAHDDVEAKPRRNVA